MYMNQNKNKKPQYNCFTHSGVEADTSPVRQHCYINDEKISSQEISQAVLFKLIIAIQGSMLAFKSSLCNSRKPSCDLKLHPPESKAHRTKKKGDFHCH